VPLAAGLSTLVTAGVLAALGSTVLGGVFGPGPGVVWAVAGGVLGTVLVDARAAALLVRDDWDAYVALRFAQPVCYLLGCVGAALLSQVWPAASVELFLAAYVLSLWLPALGVGGRPDWAPRRPTWAQLKTLLAFAGAYHAGSVLYFVSLRIDLMTMPLRFSAAELGVYAAAASAGQLAALLGSASLIRGLTGRAGDGIDRTGLVLAVGVSVGAAAAVGWLLPLFYGSAFAAAVLPARILCLGGVMAYLVQTLNGRLAGGGRPAATVPVNLVNVVGFLALLPFTHTLAGVALANVASTGAALAVASSLARHNRKVVQASCASG
jgi:O-antigen/teichoic acid export membrane protein